LSDWPGGDGGSAAAATLVGAGQLALGPRGEIFLTDINPANRVRRIAPSFGSGNADEWLVPSGDGTVRYVFSASGRHLRTETATVGYPLLAFRYDLRGRLSAIDDADGNTLTITREAAPLNPLGIRSVTLTPTEGPATTLHDDDRDGYADRITIAGDDEARAVQLGWNDQGLLTRYEDRFGITHVFGYDEQGRLTSDGFEGYPAQVLSPFEEGGRTGVTLTTAAGRTRSVAAAQDGYTLEQFLTDGVGLETTYHRDVEGRDTTTFPDGTSRSVVWRPDEILGAAVGVPQEMTLTTPSGRTLVRTVQQSTTRTPTTGRLASRTTTFTQAADTDAETTIVQTARVEPSGAATTTATTGLGRSGSAVQNERGELIRVNRPGRHPISFSYDERGRLTGASQGPDGRPDELRTITYALPRLPSESFGDVTATDATGRSAVSRTDALGRASAFADATGEATFGYDDSSRNETVEPPDRDAHVFRYDDRGRLQRYEPPVIETGATSTVYAYDDDGVLNRIEHPDGRVVQATVDGAGRFSSSTVVAGSAADRANSLAATYDAEGVLEELTWTHDASRTVALVPTFDGPLLERVELRGAVSANLGVTYDPAFRLDRMTLAAGGSASEVGYSYDGDGLLDGVLVGGERFALRLAPVSGDRELLTTRGLQTEFLIDGFGGLEREISTWGGQRLGWTQTFDAGGRVETRTTVGATAETLTYHYDGVGRLETVTRGADVTPRYSYEYDANGNRIGWQSPTSSCVSGGDANRCAEIDAQDRLRRYGPIGGADTVLLDYDARGRLQVRRDASGTTRYDYDPYGNLRTVELPSRTVRYLADPLGRRIAREVEGTRTHAWVYGEGLAPLGQLDASGRLEVTFIYLTRDWVPDLALHRDGTLYRVISDPIGSVRAVVDLTTGAVVQQYEYSPFGEIERAEETRNIVPFRFAGGLYDELTGLTRFGARDYDARVGRWTAKDPIGFEGGDTNLYGYVANDPINSIDSTGLTGFDLFQDLGAASGACVFAILRDNVFGSCGNFRANAGRCGMALLALALPFVSYAMLRGATRAFSAASSRARSALASLRCRGGGCASGACFVAGTPVRTAHNESGRQAIETVGVGDLVLPGNVRCNGDEREFDIVEILLDDGTTRVRTVHHQGAGVGDRIFVQIAEIGVSGEGTVVSRWSRNAEAGIGCRVLSTVSRIVDRIVELRLEDGDVIHATPEHLFWSEDRSRWVELSDVLAGERLRARGGVVVVAEVTDVEAASASVFNMEVEHASFYEVGDNDLFVHNGYADTFFNAHPHLRGQGMWVHHAIERQTVKRYPGRFTAAELDDLSNLRGVPRGVNGPLHLSAIRVEWNKFYRSHPNATREEIVQYAEYIDWRFGSFFSPPR
ncbi:MAG: hypothetical protein H6722_35640, partial [Sandaracinus sp.]|nr:hypothetical protein [Sandaracinus sp.]